MEEISFGVKQRCTWQNIIHTYTKNVHILLVIHIKFCRARSHVKNSDYSISECHVGNRVGHLRPLLCSLQFICVPCSRSFEFEFEPGIRCGFGIPPLSQKWISLTYCSEIIATICFSKKILKFAVAQHWLLSERLNRSQPNILEKLNNIK